jgi:hypothetical protein
VDVKQTRVAARRLYFIGLFRSGPDLVPAMYGGRPRFMKTASGARRHAGERGRVLTVDLERLPVVASDSILHEGSMTELEFAERQITAWAEIAKRIQEAKP